MRKIPLAIVCMSPGNSYFDERTVAFVLNEASALYEQIVVMIPDVPNRANWRALGVNKPDQKADRESKKLKKLVAACLATHGDALHRVKLFDWESEVGDLSASVKDTPSHQERYRRAYDGIMRLYSRSAVFRNSIRKTTGDFLVNKCEYLLERGDAIADLRADGQARDRAIDQGVHYILAEFAVLEAFACQGKVDYIYHRSWRPYEQLLNGWFDGVVRRNLGFHVIETEKHVQHDQDSNQFTSNILVPKNRVRVGYSPYPPGIFFDKTARSHRGIFVSILRRIAQNQGWELEFVKETGYGVAVEDLAKGRFDIFCSPTWPTPERESEACLSDPLFTSPVGAWVRRDHPLAQMGLAALEGSTFPIATIKNDITDMYSARLFPNAPCINAPQRNDQVTSIPQLLARVVDGRAAVTFVEPAVAHSYIHQAELNDLLVNIAADAPLDRTTNHFMVAKARPDLVCTLNAALAQFQQDGFISKLVQSYKDVNGGFAFNFLKPAVPSCKDASSARHALQH